MSANGRDAALGPVRYLILYFRSGWAFLLPYLALYLAYAWQKWPLNPGMSGLHPPALLHVYWALHALHLILGFVALRAGRKESRAADDSRWAWLPWIALGLLLWLPGAYLEFPADPWEHFGRINRWKDVLAAGPESSWYYKAGFYFMAYSFLGRLPVMLQLQGVDVLGAATALLLSWQYFRLARACGLSPQAAMVFTLLQTLLFGNDLFGFYRYYGFSSSVFAQVGATAAIRLAIELSQWRRPIPGGLFPAAPEAAVHPLVSGTGLVLAAGFAAANHVQGLAMAALGISAVLMWHAAKGGYKILVPVLVALVAAAVASSVFWPRHAVVDSFYKTAGWLNAWNGFDLFSPESAAWHRMALIVGFAGAVNLAAAVVVLRWNHVVGWLTIMPLIALQFGFVSIPFANLLARTSPAGIVTFHRLFFAIPPGLALVLLGGWWMSTGARPPRAAGSQAGGAPAPGGIAFAVMLATCAALTLIPAGYPYCNRLWNAWARVPDDLRMVRTLADFHGSPGHPATRATPKPLLIASSAISNVLQSYAPHDSLFITEERLLHSPVARSPAADQLRIQHFLDTHPSSGRPYVVLPTDPMLMFTPQSQAALLARHWNPSEVALGFVH